MAYAADEGDEDTVTDPISLADARARWFQTTLIDGGGHCPCCDRWGKEYKRAINGTMAASIGWLAGIGQPGGEWIDVPRRAPRFVLASNQLPTMAWWKMCERNDSTASEEDKKHSGYWRVTELGARWARNEVAVPRYAVTYNSTVRRLEGEMVRISDVLGERFSYADIMAR